MASKRAEAAAALKAEAASAKSPAEKLGDIVAAEIVAENKKAPKAKKASWKTGKSNAELLAYLLAHPTVADKFHTDISRLPKESRSDFLNRIYGP